MARLNATARETLMDYGIPAAEWARHHFVDGKWHGDECGCPDSRCIGYHHEHADDCDLSYWLDDYVAAGRPAQRHAFGRVDA